MWRRVKRMKSRIQRDNARDQTEKWTKLETERKSKSKNNTRNVEKEEKVKVRIIQGTLRKKKKREKNT